MSGGASVAVAEGQIVAWPISIAEWRFRIHVAPPVRQFPDAPFATARFGSPFEIHVPYSVIAPITPDPVGEADFDSPASDAFFGLPPAAGRPFDYTLRIYGVPMPVHAGGPDTQVDVAPGRIDVADVPYTKADGSVVPIRGTWTLTRRAGAPGPDQAWSINSTGSGAVGSEAGNGNPFPTHLGVDVIPGTYDVTVDWDSTQYGGSPGSQSYTVTVP